MRNVDRIDKTLSSIKEIWEKHPDLRLGQLLINVASEPLLYYIEEDELIHEMKRFYDFDK